MDDPHVVAHAILPVGAGATDVGQREHNEDHVLIRPELGLFLLADGAGGHNAGNVASALATTTVANVFETSAKTLADRPEVDAFGMWTMARRLASAVQRANAEIVENAKRTAKYTGMGTTLVALAFSEDGGIAHVAHVGDSRCYRMRGGFLDPLTTDHSLFVDVLETHPDADDELLARLPRHVVTSALGMQETVRVTVRSLRVAPGDLFLLCSDGLTDTLDELRIEALLGEPRSPGDYVHALVSAAVEAGAQDNVGVVVVACQETEQPPRRRPSGRPVEPPPPPDARSTMGSAPEIIILGVEMHVVPEGSANAPLLDAIGRFHRLRQPSLPEAAQPKPARCRECGQPLEASARACPTCSAPVVV